MSTCPNHSTRSPGVLRIPVGTAETRLVVLRGNSGSGKSSVAQALRTHLGRGTALVQQDVIRRLILKEHDVVGGNNIDLIDQIVRFSLERGYDVICEGILHADRYADMLTALQRDHEGTTAFYYLDVSWAETVRRHALRPQAREFGPEQMREWYAATDLLGVAGERLVAEESSLECTVALILAEVFSQARGLAR